MDLSQIDTRPFSTQTSDDMPDTQDYPNIRSLGGKIIDVRRLVNPEDKNWSATNPSIAKAPRRGYCMTIRSSNYVIMPSGELRVVAGDKIQNNVWFADLDKDFKIKDLRKIDCSTVGVDFRRGLEDPKLFWRDGHWQFTAVVAEKHTPYARQAVCHLDKKATKITDIKIYPGVDAKRPEKNWMLSAEPNPYFDFIYAPNATVKDRMLTTWMTDHPKLAKLRGTSLLLPLEDGYLGILHEMVGKTIQIYNEHTFGFIDGYDKVYIHHFAKFDETGNVVALSDGFQFHEPGIEFAAGLSENNKEYIISFGRNDVSSHIAFLPKSTVLKMLIDLEY